MTFKRHKRADEELTAEFSGVIERLEAERPDVTALEMDEIKVRAMRRAARSRPGYVPGLKGVGMRRSAATFLVIASLMAGGTGAAIAGGDDNGNHDGGKSQYGCPPGTHGSHCKPASQSQQQPPPPTHQSNRGSHGSHAPPPPQSHHGSHGGWNH